jgi:hypothetical protein
LPFEQWKSFEVRKDNGTKLSLYNYRNAGILGLNKDKVKDSLDCWNVVSNWREIPDYWWERTMEHFDANDKLVFELCARSEQLQAYELCKTKAQQDAFRRSI